VDGAQPGIVMLGQPDVGDYYRQEYYQGHAEDVARVREVGATMNVGDTTYENVLVTEDFLGARAHRARAQGLCP
jgi:hypothetical protein